MKYSDMIFHCQRTTCMKKINRRFWIYLISLLLPMILLPLAISTYKESRCAYVLLLVSGYWFLEPTHVAATALLPIVLFPILDVVSSREICNSYMTETFMMFIGGLIVAVAVEDCKLHERIALKALLLIGTEFKWLMLGFMLTTMFLSMWINNMSTTAMMVPIVDAVIEEIAKNDDDIEMENKGRQSYSLENDVEQIKTEIYTNGPVEAAFTVYGDFPNYNSGCSQSENEETGKHKAENSSVSKRKVHQPNSSALNTTKIALLLSICYSANIGGTGSLTGSAPNMVLKGLINDFYPESNEITFASWLMYSVPGMLLCIFIAWIYLWIVYIRQNKKILKMQSNQNIKEIIKKRYDDLGSIKYIEINVLILFLILVFLWIFRDPKFISGWADAVGSDTKIGHSFPAILVAFFLFFLPANPRNIGGRPLLEWKTAQSKVPWGVIILIGGGFALADAAHKSGLSRMIGAQLSSLSVLPPVAIVAIVCFMTAMITEIISNTATSTILLPVLNEMATSIGVNPLYLMLPAAISCSYAFILPVATPPNALAFESGNMRTVDMAKPGVLMNLICCSVQILTINTLGVALFDLNNFPSWANQTEKLTSDVALESIDELRFFQNSTESSLFLAGVS